MQVELRVSAGVDSKPTRRSTPEWLDEDFLQLCMQSGESDPTIRILNYSVKLAKEEPAAYSTPMYRVSVEFKRRPRSRNILDFKPQEVRSLVIKTLPQCDQQSNTYKEAQVFEKEMSMLSKTIPAIHKVLGVHHLAAHCLYSQMTPHALIVLEDLQHSGFAMAIPKRHRGLDLDHCMLVMRSLATFHAASIVVHEKDPSSMKEYDYNVWCTQGQPLVKEFVERAVIDVADEVSTWPGCNEKYAVKIRGLRSKLLPRVNAAVSRDPAGFNVLLHGDCWFSNLMFRYCSNRLSVEDLMFVDFQNSVFSSPAIDLQQFLYSSPADEVRSQHYNRLLQHYHATLVETMEKVKAKTKPPTLDELKRDIANRSAYSVLVAFTLLPIVVGDRVASPEILHDPDAEKQRRLMYSTENYKVALKRLLPFFDSRGLLE